MFQRSPTSATGLGGGRRRGSHGDGLVDGSLGGSPLQRSSVSTKRLFIRSILVFFRVDWVLI
jgi:hypothetical protein